MKTGELSAILGLLLALTVLAGSLICRAADGAPADTPVQSPSLYIKVQLEKPLKVSKLKPGDAGESTLTVSLISINWQREVRAQAKKKPSQQADQSTVEVSRSGGLYGPKKLAAPVMAGVDKEADDTFQLIFDAIVSTATDASTAGTARIIASCGSGIYMVTRHGRDVILPRFTEMNITLNRPLSVTEASRSKSSPERLNRQLKRSSHWI